MEHLAEILSQNKAKLTQPRIEIFNILNNHEHPLLISEIANLAKQAEKTSVYRTLDLFIKLGIVEIINIGWKHQYELAEPFRAHHHHLICTKCGTIVKIDQPKLEAVIDSICSEYKYSNISHHVELRGICERCQSIN